MADLNIKYFQISENICELFDKILDSQKFTGSTIESSILHKTTRSRKAFQTVNLYTANIEHILDSLVKEIGLGKYLYHDAFHMIEYKKGGYQKGHDHRIGISEYGYILYLTTCCQGGETVFKKGSLKKIVKPERRKLILFDRELFHYARPTVDLKKVAVGSLRLRDQNQDPFLISVQ